MSASKFEVKYGLPAEVRFCSICNMSNQRPDSTDEYSNTADKGKSTIVFDEDMICRACRYKERMQATVNWEEREEELLRLCDKHRRNDGSYDCIVPGSGGKDSVYASHVLKYKYNMHPLTCTWSPHLYTDIGWKNFQAWIHEGGFDNYLFTPNGKVHRLLTRLATLNLFHPFQPFIMGQKTFAMKFASKFNIPLVFFGESPAEYGAPVSDNAATFEGTECDGYRTDYGQSSIEELYFGGVNGAQIIQDHGVDKNDLLAYTPLPSDIVQKKGIQVHYLGYYLPWDPQECYYYAVENAGFEANPLRSEGTYSKYSSLDDKIDPFHYYTMYLKFGIGRAMNDSTQEVRNKKITTEEGKLLIKKFDGEFPQRYFKEFLDYVSITEEKFHELCEEARSEHLWTKVDGEWQLRYTPIGDGADQ